MIVNIESRGIEGFIGCCARLVLPRQRARQGPPHRERCGWCSGCESGGPKKKWPLQERKADEAIVESRGQPTVKGRRRCKGCAEEAKKGAEKNDAKNKDKQKKSTYSSRTKLPKDMPPQLMPPIRLPASDSLRLRLTLSRFWLLTEMGLGPALTKESWRERPKAAPVVMVSRASAQLDELRW